MKYNYIPLSIAATFLLLHSTSAFAYLDPGTGSLIIQGIIGAIFGGLFTIKLYGSKLVSFFKRNHHGNEKK